MIWVEWLVVWWGKPFCGWLVGWLVGEAFLIFYVTAPKVSIPIYTVAMNTYTADTTVKVWIPYKAMYMYNHNAGLKFLFFSYYSYIADRKKLLTHYRHGPCLLQYIY